MDLTSVSAPSIVKLLASCNQPTRSRAIRLLCRWLPQQSSAVDSLSDGGDLIKIWKGLFYCVWHADKAPYQLDLINRLSSLQETLNPNLSILYFETFLVTIRREWCGIDFLRLDKFYLLIRKFIHRFFAFLKKSDWDLDLLNRSVGILKEKCLLANDKFQAGGVNYHLAEVFFDEIDGFLPIKPEILDLLLTPFVSVLERSSDRVLVNKIKVNVFERIVENGMKYLKGERSGAAEKLGKYAFVLGFSGKLFKSASDEGTVQGNRKVLFGLHERFLKLEKDFEKSGLEILFEDLGNGNDEGKLLSSNDTEMGVGNPGLEISPPKKRKKEAEASLDGLERKNKAKKKRSGLSDSAVDGNGKIDDNDNNDDDDADDGENGIESNAAETNSKSFTPLQVVIEKKKKKKKKKKNKKNLADSPVERSMSSESAVESNGKIVADATTSNGENGVESKSAETKSKGAETKSKSNKKEKKSLLGSAAKINGEIGGVAVEENQVAANGDVIGNDDLINFNESVISNLQKQFEKVAAEEGMALPATPMVVRRRKRAKCADELATPSNGESVTGKSGDKSVKKVRFSLKNNLVWKPQAPMPPQSLRLPPSATPRGSALKKGMPPGPVKVSPASVKKIKAKGSSIKKARKSLKRGSPAVKRLRKSQSLSA